MLNKSDTFKIQEPVMESNDLLSGTIKSHFIQFFLQQLIQVGPETLKLYIMSYDKSKSIQLTIQSNL